MIPHEPRSSALLNALGEGADEAAITFEQLLQSFDRRSFGVLLVVVVLPAFLPLPAGAGAVSGPLAALLGLQLLLGLHRPWLPAALRRRGIERARWRAFTARIAPWLQRLERLCRPRLESLVRSTGGNRVTGLLLFLLGLLLSLPIPLTNYPLALLILCYGVALLERDGALMAALWLIGAGTVAAMLALSNGLLDLLRGWIGG